MGKRIESTILFCNELVAKVWAQYPFEKVEIEPLSSKFNGLGIDHYYAIVGDDTENPTLIDINNDPLNFVTYLYQGLSGSYVRATQSKVVEEEDADFIQKQNENNNLTEEEREKMIDEILKDLPNIDYYDPTLNWLQRMRKEE